MIPFRKKMTVLLVCCVLVVSLFTVTGCGQEKAQYSVFWSMDQSETPESAYMLHQLKDVFSETEGTDEVDENKETIFNTLTLEMFPGSQKTATFKIWNKQETPDTKTTFKISADSDWIIFPEKRIELTTPKESEGEKKESKEEEQQILTHVGSEVNIRSGATTKSDILLQTETYSTYPFLSKAIGEDDDMVWYEIELGVETIGWVRSDMATIKSADGSKQTSQIISELSNFITVACEIILPEDIRLPLESTITITPSNGEETTLKIKIIEPDWWSVKWVSSGTENLLINLYEGKPKQLGFEIKNDSIYEAEFEILSEDKNIYIEDIKPITLKPGESKSTLLWIRPGGLIGENTKIKELITITATKIIPEKEDANGQNTKENGADNSKQLHLEIILKRSYVKIVWEETGTDTITVEHYPYESVFRNVLLTNETDKAMCAVNIGETKSLPFRIISSDLVIYCGFENNPLKVNHIIKPPPCDIKPAINWKVSKGCIFTQYTDDKLIALVSDKKGIRKLQCYDLNTAEFLWEYPKKNNPDYDKITKSLILKDVSSEFDKVIIQYNYQHNYKNFRYNLDGICCCIDANDGSTTWTIESLDFLSVFGDTDRFLVAGEANDSYYEYCRQFECRKLTTGDVIWSECLNFGHFVYADGELAYFWSIPPGEAGWGGVLTAENPPKKIDKYIPDFYPQIIFPKESSGKEIIDNWSERKRIEHDLSNCMGGSYLSKDGLIVQIEYNCGDSVCDLYQLTIYNAKSGNLVATNMGYPKIGSIDYIQSDNATDFSNYYNPNYSYYNVENEILELGGYFFKIPSGEHIDLPTSYRLQHYSETTGNYYFLDTEKGEIVCVTLPGSQ